ncbi:hypothetical protein A0J61_05299 [Choanephora cucurbitarum]|uniref:Uncharacterized protein n=1 Tax=Choanephora cucurbitarum TaxID=101091 RepID=A0A1C7NH03_9FUNG|nr:hypothetical protein A0J61_05299 [Choanephora cucurbitarum]
MSKDSYFELELSDRNVVPEQQLRQELIQRATSRLRRRVLEQGLQDIMRDIASLQAQLDTLRLEAVTTMDTMANVSEDPKTAEGTQRMNRQMDILEKRLESHKSGLFQLQSSNLMAKVTSTQSSTSMSRLSSLSLMPSIFCRSDTTISQATSVSDNKGLMDEDTMSEINCHSSIDDDDPFYDLAGKRSFRAGSFCGSVYHENQQIPTVPIQDGNSTDIRQRRRQRRQRHRQSMERRQREGTDDSVYSEDLSSVSSLGQKEIFHHPLSPIMRPIGADGYLFDNSMESWLSSYSPNMLNQLCPQRNVLDEAMSFLDENDDGGFEEDIYLLLQNPDLCSRPLSEIEATMNELRLQERKGSVLRFAIQLLKPTAWYQLGLKYSGNLVYQMTCYSLQWCRFLSVLSAAVVISIMKGPDDIQI